MASGNRPIEFTFIADVAKYLREVKKMEVSTEDVADALVATTSSAEDLERKLSKAMKDSAKDTEVLERAIKDIPKATEGAADDARQDFDRLGDSAADAGSEVGDEFKQNLGQSLASGDMSALLTDTLGGLVASLKGPVGLAGAAIAGIAALAFNEVKQQAEELQGFTESMAGAISSLYEQGIRNATAREQLDAFNTFLGEQSDKIQDLEDDFHNAGVASDEYLTSIFQGGPALDTQRDKLVGILDTLSAQSLTTEGLTTEQLKQNDSATVLLAYLDAQAGVQGDIAGKMGTQADASQLLAQRLGLVDTNGDGVVNDMDKVADSLTTSAEQAWLLSEHIKNIPKNVVVAVEIDQSSVGQFAGGAFALSSGGRVKPIYGQAAVSP